MNVFVRGIVLYVIGCPPKQLQLPLYRELNSPYAFRKIGTLASK